VVHRLVNPLDPFPDMSESISTTSHYSLNPLSYAHIAHTGHQTNISEGTHSNKEDIVTQSNV
jgi:hypothetical protein